MIIGASLRRKEDPRLLAGRGRYVDDLALPGMLHAVLVRSPHAHAVVRRVDLAAARTAPGVALVASATDLGEVEPIPVRLGAKPSLAPFLQRPLARDRVRYVGEPVALVVADSRYRAEDAAELVAVDYAPLPALLDAEAALAEGAPVLHQAAGTNRADLLRVGLGDPDAALAGAEVRIRRRLSVGRHTGVPMETRGLLAAYDSASDALTVWGPTKVPHFNRRVLADLLGWSPERIRFVEPEVGGGFGVRGEFYPEDFLIPWAAVRLGRPVKWTEDRREHLVATNHSRQQVHEIELGATRDGRIVALTDRVTVDMGAYLRTHGVTVPELTLAMLPGPYRIPHYRCEVACALTTKTPTGTYRAPGRFEANFARERMLDLLADAVGLDPAEVRRRNFVPPEAMPYDVGTATLGHRTVYDTGRYASTLDAALEAVGYDGLRRQQPAWRAAGRLVGVGIGCFVEKAGPGPWEYARVELRDDGRAVVYSGGASVGQGIETVLAQICAEALGLRYDDVTVVHGDTDLVPQGIGAWGSRITVVGGGATAAAAREVRRRLLAVAAAVLEASPDDLVVADGAVWVQGTPSRRATVREVIATARARGEAFDLSAAHVFHAEHMTYPYGAHVAVVEVDADTGQVRVLDYAVAYDVGRAVNPMLVEGQIIGGLAQGLGGALLEEFVYDEGGQPLAVTFMDYLLPTVAEMPARVVTRVLEETPTPLNPLGAKGAGEGGTAAAGAAIANAVTDALRPLGVEVSRLPLSPDRLADAITRAWTPTR
ncbi:MAG: xanthine dehydrogenase family protein molybdopterin-binding subunit [Armatimonadota bacterium]|nr:xanthine dehydrogenase family protein molybdopterin-binding subunit [Armatimonadota bacterium]